MQNNNKFNPNSKWFQKGIDILIRLEQGKPTNIGNIPKEKFLNCNREEQTQLLKGMLTPLLRVAQVSKYGNILCFLPHGETFEKRPSMEFDEKNSNLHCWACMELGKTKDLFDIIGYAFNMNSFVEQKLKAIELFVEDGLSLANEMRINSSKRKTSYQKMERPSSTEKAFAATTGRYYKLVTDDQDCLRFLEQRGITLESAEKYKLKFWEYQGNKYLVIPCDNQFYTRRKFKTGLGDYPKYWKKKDASVSLFNGNRLVEDNAIVFVVESALDAIIMEQIGLPCVALNGKDHYKSLIESCSRDTFLIILMDNDPAGLTAGLRIATELRKKEVDCYLHRYPKKGIIDADFLSKFKDLGEAYVADPIQTTESVVQIYDSAYALSLIQPAKEKSVDMTSFSNPLEKFGRAEGSN
ncbi:toprim domain-containing protein [Schinkia azotoformans]|uniref:toprim domain-containing protein n=1 Tax=Schinkia azotoformans TaxID=1454 RepID=UPI002DB7DC17|nr:toprim domain-containing protein [Schinkia azotoformans]MEC1718741.1 toprim domain-containing protein [Schinkia azotoformans]MEC1742768.1 toprim domain-containing protein [Schinkia azotoformans]MEC1748110.1 toprim domain-containing protein [Schinkia azotoformans]MEC1760555.1 toprim domain-containing protein [Schinkia azotoformans]MEC1769286.1 toprim domain-containing protein [Schinkia azotoformans]